MAKKNAQSDKKSRLETLGRDLNRTFLHGSRPVVNTLGHKPAAWVTGQQIRVDAPDQGPMNFLFELAGDKLQVPVKDGWAQKYRQVMTNVIAEREKYLSLRVDDHVPTWVFHQRDFSFPKDNNIPPEDKLEFEDKKLMRIPSAALQEVQRVATIEKENDGDPTKPLNEVSLWHCDRHTQESKPIPSASWKPAILLRFPLKVPEDGQVKRAADTVYEILGTPQGERFYLDQLNLLSSVAPSVKIDDMSFHLEEKPGTTVKTIDTWTIARNNLTEEARPNISKSLSYDSVPRPFVATSEDAEPFDAVRLLQMLSITNSGGYYLRVPVDTTYTTLVVCITLAPDDPDRPGSVALPLAANAVLYETEPDVMRFEGIESIQVTPFAPPGYVAFGWNRPGTKGQLEELFAYHNISLVDYRGVDAAGNLWQYEEKVTPISPLSELPGELFERNVTVNSYDVAGDRTRGRSSIAALRLLSQHQYDAYVASKHITPAADDLRFYRGQMRCYKKKEGEGEEEGEEEGESPYAPLSSELRRNITVTPGLRDVFGNRFKAEGGQITQRLFYTDALKAPAEWPGFRFSLYPTQVAEKPAIALEVCYTRSKNDEDRESRRASLLELKNQLNGARSDVEVRLIAKPLLDEVDLTVDLVDWLEGTLIPLEEKPRKDPDTEEPKPLFLEELNPFPCQVGVLARFVRFEPKIKVRRTDDSLLPQTPDLPTEATLARIIRTEIEEADSSVLLQQAASPRRFGKQSEDEEFRQVALAFDKIFSEAMRAKVGFLRNQVNQHELYFLPDAMFPTAPLQPADQQKWAFSTARPLNNTLETDLFRMPVFDAGSEVDTSSTFHGYPIPDEQFHFIEQDYDELGRTAFGLIERALTPIVVTDSANTQRVREILEAKDAVARTLASWGGEAKKGPQYMVPIFVADNDVDGPAVRRLAEDAFLKSLAAFYNVETVVQLPLADPKPLRSPVYSMLFGRVEPPWPSDRMAAGDDPSKPLPVFSDVLLKASEEKLTLLYDVPPGTKDPNSAEYVPAIKESDELKVVFTHVQMDAEDASVGNDTGLHQGPWLELVSPLTLAWRGIGTPIPVALRKFPAKPIAEKSESTLADLGPVVGKEEVTLLLKWGWRFTFYAEGLRTDKVHVTVRYNEPEKEKPRFAYGPEADWQPRNLLHCLLAFKAVSDHWADISADKKLPILSDLMSSLGRELNIHAIRSTFRELEPRDTFAVSFKNGGPELEEEKYEVMKKPEILEPEDATSIAVAGLRGVEVTVTAPAKTKENGAYLIGPTPVYNFRPSFRLMRNETINERDVDSRLVYECASVESPREIRARNSWTETLQYESQDKQGLKKSLEEFFASLLNGTDLSSLDLEVNSALHCRRNGLVILTPFSLIPSDMMPKRAFAVSDLAVRIYEKFNAFVENSPPKEVDEAWLRLRIKAGRPNSRNAGERTLVEIASIDFPLPKPRAKKRTSSRTKA